MRLLFNVLWVDDQPASIEGYKYNIEPTVTEEGFRLNVISAKNMKEASQHLSELGILFDNIDLVVIDYNLGEKEETGDKVAKEIRKKVPFKDIVFYSADNIVELQTKISEQEVEGVYCAHRDDLVPKVRGLFKDIVRRVVDLEHVRGIVMGASSDFERVVVEAVVALESGIAAEHIDELISYADGKLEKMGAAIIELRARIAESKSLKDLVEDFKFDAHSRLGLIRRVLRLRFDNEHKELDDHLGQYTATVLPLRNKLGHARIRIVGGTKLVETNGVEIDAAKLKELQSQLIAFMDHFERLADLASLPR